MVSWNGATEMDYSLFRMPQTRPELDKYFSFAPSSNGVDDLAVLTSLVNAFGSNGGILILRGETYLVSNTFVVPNKVVVRGQGRSATYIKATATFPVSTPVVQLGPLVSSYAFNTRLENLTVDANSITDSTGVYAERLQEQSGLSGCVVSNFKKNGMDFNGIGNADFGVDRCEVYPATGANYGVYFNGSAGSNFIRECTVGVQGSLVAAIYAKNAFLFAQSLHMENCTDGLVWDASSGTFSGITGPTTAANVTNLVRMLGSSRYVSGLGVTKNSCTNAIKDEFFGKTITDAYVPAWVGGDQYVARFNHYGDKLGFYGTTQISKPALTYSRTGESAAAAQIRTTLSSLGLVTDSTTA